MNPLPIIGSSSRSFSTEGVEALSKPGLRSKGEDKLAGAVAFWSLLQSAAVEPVETPADQGLESLAAPVPEKVIQLDSTSTLEKPKEATARLEGQNGPTDEVHVKTPIKPEDERFLEWMLESASQATATPNVGTAVAWQPLASQLPLQWAQNGGEGGSASVASTMGDAVTAWLKGDAMRGKTLRVSLAGQADLILKIQGGKVQAQFVGYDAGMLGVLQQTSRDLQSHLASKQLPVASITWRDESQQQHQPNQQNPDDADDNDLG